MKITFIYHSCFVVEMESANLVFDYFKGTLPQLDPDKPLYVFASHKHKDHFSMDIFKVFAEYKSCIFVLSNDIKINRNYLIRHGIEATMYDKIYRIGKNQDVELRNELSKIQVETLKSSDEGVAFIITCDGKVIYHAGDLNWWSWIGESEEESEEAANKYLSQLNKIEGRYFDIAFLVTDPRQQERYSWGIESFLKSTETRVVIPMHCWEEYSIMERLLTEDSIREYRNQIIPIRQENQVVLEE